jgi:hypothetical protein
MHMTSFQLISRIYVAKTKKTAMILTCLKKTRKTSSKSNYLNLSKSLKTAAMQVINKGKKREKSDKFSKINSLPTNIFKARPLFLGEFMMV